MHWRETEKDERQPAWNITPFPGRAPLGPLPGGASLQSSQGARLAVVTSCGLVEVPALPQEGNQLLLVHLHQVFRLQLGLLRHAVHA